ncbi:hypothetical protein ACIBP6_15870 [Nonomuraea terrae]|uniref:hypothetical protein n=1 Tax=Nonomuraea terrae TaxID=2530383 RepID=UPI003799802A
MRRLMDRVRTFLRRFKKKQPVETATPTAAGPQTKEKKRRWLGKLRRHQGGPD